MIEKKLEVKTFMTSTYCDCGGEIFSSGEVLTSMPPKYKYQCGDCGTYHILNHHSPIINYEVIKDAN